MNKTKGVDRSKTEKRKLKKAQVQNGSENGGEVVEVVVFKLSDFEHAVALRYVQEIMTYQGVEPIAETPESVEGVVKLRGHTIPVIDLRQRFHLPRVAENVHACLVIIRAGDYMAGLVVDSVVEMLRVPLEAVEAPTELIGGIHKDYIIGIVYIEQRILVMLDIRKILQIEAETWDRLRAYVPSEKKIETASPGIRKVFSFRLGNERYGVEIGKVSEILRMDSIMPVPNVQDFVAGIVNVRGDIVPVIDLTIKFGLNRKLGRSPAIVLLETEQYKVGLLVEEMPKLRRLPEKAFQPVPSGIDGIEPYVCREVCRLDDAMLAVLDIDKILTETRKDLGDGKTDKDSEGEYYDV